MEDTAQRLAMIETKRITKYYNFKRKFANIYHHGSHVEYKNRNHEAATETQQATQTQQAGKAATADFGVQSDMSMFSSDVDEAEVGERIEL